MGQEVNVMDREESFFKKRVRKVEKIYQYQKERWIYRGQKDSKWGLETSLERACKNYGYTSKKTTKDNEDLLLREFQRKYHHYSHYMPNSDNTLEWLSLMQHYGAPTRLLDFTYSVFVAAYFALEKADNDSAVWAINGRWAMDGSASCFTKGSQEWDFIKGDIIEENEKIFNKTFRRPNPKAFVCQMNPFRLNERLTIQKGVFMCPGNANLPFESNLKNLRGWNEKENIVKIIIPYKLRREVLDSLSNMNISRATLFPSLDGFAQSLSVSLPVKWG
jgi:hypothetical protein